MRKLRSAQRPDQACGRARRITHFALAVTCLAGSTMASSQVSTGPAPLATQSVSFASLGMSSVALNGVVTVGGLSFAERFAGQSVFDAGGHDQLGGFASGPLTLQPGAAGRNLSAAYDGSITYLTGVAFGGYPNVAAIGEGSVAVLFPTDQRQFSFRTYHASGDGGDMHFSFWRRNGSFIDTVTLAGVSDGTKSFVRDGGLADIAGVSIWSSGGNGVLLYEAVNYVAPVPEPSTLALTALGIGSLGWWQRRRSQRRRAQQEPDGPTPGPG